MNIGKVFIDQTSVTINGILTSQDHGDVPFWMAEKYFTEYIDAYFVIDPYSHDHRGRLADTNSRVANFSNYYNSNDLY